MKLIRAVSCWGNEARPAEALSLAMEWGFEAVEGPMPADARGFGRAVRDEGKQAIAEIATGCEEGYYVPDLWASPQDHLEDFRRKLDRALEAQPLKITTLAGSDLWDFASSRKFLEQLLAIARQAGATVSVETHRARPTFHPLQTLGLLEELPELSLTLDVSHWCVVCERLMARELALMAPIEARVAHIHARIGYDQGPQVPDPREPRYGEALAAHLACWRRVAGHLQSKDAGVLTITPEFGPDGYLLSHPSTDEPVADLRELNRWMGAHFVECGFLV